MLRLWFDCKQYLCVRAGVGVGVGAGGRGGGREGRRSGGGGEGGRRERDVTCWPLPCRQGRRRRSGTAALPESPPSGWGWGAILGCRSNRSCRSIPDCSRRKSGTSSSSSELGQSDHWTRSFLSFEPFCCCCCVVSPQTRLVSVVWQSLMYKEEEQYIVNEAYALYINIWEFIRLFVWCDVRVIAQMDDRHMFHS